MKKIEKDTMNLENAYTQNPACGLCLACLVTPGVPDTEVVCFYGIAMNEDEE